MSGLLEWIVTFDAFLLAVFLLSLIYRALIEKLKKDD